MLADYLIRWSEVLWMSSTIFFLDVTSSDFEISSWSMSPLASPSNQVQKASRGAYQIHCDLHPFADTAASSIYKVIANNIEEWNEALEEQWVSWTERPGTTGAIFSSYDVFEKILTNPTQYSFRPTDPYTPNGGIWYDHLHPTTKVHEILYTALKEEWLSGKIGLGGGG